MKKSISVLLVLVLAFSCCAFAVNAADNLTNVYFVDKDPNSSGFEIVPVSGTKYVTAGEPFSFTIEATGGTAFDQTTTVRYFSSKYIADTINGDDTAYGDYIYPDADGIYTIEAVNEDIYVRVYNLQSSGIASVKDFLFNMFNFFLNLMKWFFGLGK